MIKYSIIIPVFNEEKNLNYNFTRFIRWMNSFLDSHPEKKGLYELIFAEDGSTDNTLGVINRIKNDLNCLTRTIHSKKRLGKGGGFKNGFLNANGEIIVLYDVDMAVSPDQIPHLIEMVESGYDIVFGSRRHKLTIIHNFPSPIRYVYGVFLGILAKVMFYFPFGETQCGFKAFSRDKVLPLVKNMKVTGWLFDLDILLSAYYLGLKILEIPVAYNYINESKINKALDPVKILHDLFRLRLKILGYYPVPPFKPKFRRIYCDTTPPM